ncbi:MAG: hypothetical protein KIT83_21010 [Bryobacterales bacterium]|nr:hypothetical protein [Bryobacterales bacterium]
MTTRNPQRDHAPLIAILGAMMLMAHMISGKAARDSLFLLNFPIEMLPRMTVAAAVASLFFVIGWARKLATRSPAELVPWTLLGASGLQFLLWGLYELHPGASAVLFYFYMIGPNAILLSSYWSLLNERFDPRQAKKIFGRITAGGTFGGVVSGALADQVADYFGPSSLLPLLGILQLIAFLLVRRLANPTLRRPPAHSAKPTDFIAGFRYIRSNRYLFTLASLVFLVTTSAGLLDYVFKDGVTATLGRGEHLVTFFALFYAFSGLATFLMQSFVAPLFFQRFGLTQSLLALPAAYFAGVLSNLAIPGLPGLVIMRGFESVTRGSIYRSGYEICYTPVSTREKRASKTIIDVGADRLGEAAGGVLLQGMLLTGMAGLQAGILLVGCALSAMAGFLTYRMGRLYIATLETSLINRAREMAEETEELPNFDAETVVMGSMAGVSVLGQPVTGLPAEAEGPLEGRSRSGTAQEVEKPEPLADIPTSRGTVASTRLPADDGYLQKAAVLRSGDVLKVRALLASGEALEPAHVPILVRLLAWDEVSDAVVHVLRAAPFPLEGQLADALLHRDEDFDIRRRIPRVLSARPCQLSAEGLLQGLRDQRFEVRFRCGRALARITSLDGGLIIDRDRILRAVERECFVSKTVWNSYRLLDRRDDTEESLYFDEVLKDRTSKGLEHVFTLLSLVLPREALQIAFKGLHTTDPYLRGTALEYLDSVLPENIRERLWPLLESDARPQKHQGRPRSRDEILADLRRSNQSIIVNLERLRGHGGSSADTGKPPQGQTDGSGLEPPVEPDKRKEP